jgi:hypothetical protein
MTQKYDFEGPKSVDPKILKKVRVRVSSFTNPGGIA